MRKFPYSKQHIDKKDINEVISALKSEFLTQGPMVEKFEKVICEYVGSKYAVAVSSCSAGLHLACLAASKKKIGNIITSPVTFVSTASAILHAKKKLIFCDISNTDINIDISEIKKIFKKKKIEGVIPVHFSGNTCKMNELQNLCNTNKAYIIEDAAHALGSKYKCGNMVGSCKYSLMTVFSFHPLKTVTTGEGGIITTNSKKIYEKLKLLRSHGISKTLSKSEIKKKPWFYKMSCLGFHYRLTDLQCSLGISQMKKINIFLESRRRIVNNYLKLLKNNLYFEPALIDNLNLSSNHLFVIRIKFNNVQKIKYKLINFLKKKNIFTQVHYIPLPLQPYFKKLGFKINNLPNAKDYYKEAISLPVFYGLKFEDQQNIINQLNNFIKKKIYKQI